MERNKSNPAVGAAQSRGRSAPNRPMPAPHPAGRSSFAGTPEKYAMAVNTFAERSKESYLHPGTHYWHLATFFRPSTLSAAAPGRVAPSAYTHVVIHECSRKDGRKLEEYDGQTGLAKLPSLPPPEQDCSRLIFIRGHSSRDWLLQIGAQNRIDPEYFRRHLDFLQPKDFYDLPTLPSSSRNIVSLTITTVCTRETALTQNQLDDARREEGEAVRKHQRQLGASGKLGESITRKFCIHDESTFTLEQNITICVKRKSSSWVALIWLDAGRDLSEGPEGPWLTNRRATHAFQRLCHPVIQHRPKAALLYGDIEAKLEHRGSDPSEELEASQNVTLLPSQYGSTLDNELMAVDSLYALSELFEFAASSESQFLNMMQGQINRDIHFLPEKMEFCVANLKHSKTILDEHAQRARNIIELLRNPSLLEWPRAPTKPVREQLTSSETASNRDSTPGRTVSNLRGEETIDRALHNLLLDFEHLLELAKSLSKQCLEGTDIIMNSAMLEESRKSISQQQGLTRLTLLAFFFLPLTFTTGFFGMNFQQLGNGTLSIWVLFVVLVPVLGVSGIVCFWDSLPQVTRRRRNSFSRKVP